jgi:lipoprotein-releasing system permease protein
LNFLSGFRYLKSKKHQAFISFNTLLSICIVLLGVFILIVVISVMNGFQAKIKDKIIDVDAHITVNGFNGHNFEDGIKNYREAVKLIKENSEVVSAEPYFQGQGILRVNSTISAVLIRGVGSGVDIPADYLKFIDEGQEGMPSARRSFQGPDVKEVFIGKEMAELRNVFIGDIIELIVPKGRFDAIAGSAPGVERFYRGGVF